MQPDRDANRAVFRRANEELLAFAGDVLAEEPETFAPFLCECADRACTRVVRLTVSEFEEASGGEGQFVVLPGHERKGDDMRVVQSGERFALVRRTDAETAA